ncbi:trypsin-like serine protease [Streptomyces sp. WM6378]|uniref:trypsin-like serine protease n=1 Tax=Streptomyces sp. WM6378 TaxID=1415557 RepID=UPI00099BE3A2
MPLRRRRNDEAPQVSTQHEQPPGLDFHCVVEADLSTAGWEATSQGGSLLAALRTVDVPTADRGTCRTAYGTSEEVTEHMLCAGLTQGGKDFCAGDEGGTARHSQPARPARPAGPALMAPRLRTSRLPRGLHPHRRLRSLDHHPPRGLAIPSP